MWEMTRWTPDVSQWRIIMTIMIQGAGLGFVFLPLQVLAFATLPPQYRTDGASLFSLFRNIGAAIGVSVTSSMLAHNTQVLHEQIGCVGDAVQSRPAGRRRGEPGLEPVHRARGGDAGPDRQSAGADHRLYRRLLDDDLHHAAVAAASVAAPAAQAGIRRPVEAHAAMD